MTNKELRGLIALEVADPTAGVGVEGRIGDVGSTNEANPRLFLKTGTANNAWNQISSSNSPVGSVSVATNYYLDSVNGSDSNTGLSVASPKQSVAGLGLGSGTSNAVVYVAGDSELREQLNLGDFCIVQKYGNGDNPIFNGADIATNASFSLTATTTNVYEISWTFEDALVDVIPIYEDDEPLIWATSIANCEATPGSFYNSGTTSPATIYVHASDSSNVTSNGKVYEIARREHAIKLGDNCKLYDVTPKNGVRADGCLITGKNFHGERFQAKHGTKHIGFFQENLYLRDVDIYHSDNKNSLANTGLLVLYANNLAGGSFVLDNVKIHNKRGVSTAGFSALCHNAVNSTTIDYVHIKNSTIENLDQATGNFAVSDHIRYTNTDFVECGTFKTLTEDVTWYFENCNFTLSDSSDMSTSAMFTGGNGTGNTRIIMRGCNFNMQATRLFYGTFAHFDVRYSTFFAQDGQDSNLNFSFYDGIGFDLTANSGGDFIFKNNIVGLWRQPWRLESTSFTGWRTLDVDNNYYIIPNGLVSQYDTGTTTNGTFSDWQTDTGQDANSVEINESAITIVPNKRVLNPQVANMSIVAGADTWTSYGKSITNDSTGIPALRSLV